MEKICKLCHKKKKLIKSHIIPEFVYDHLNLFDEHHQIRKSTLSTLINNISRVLKPSSGEYEKGLLCEVCDNEIIGQYESYGKIVMFGSDKEKDELLLSVTQHFKDASGAEFSICYNLDYGKFKLFLLSILWRMSISSRPMFNTCKLQDDEEEKLRQMILVGDPGNINDFPIVSHFYLNDEKMPTDIIGQPMEIEYKGDKVIRILIGGVFLLFHITYGKIDEEKIKNVVLNKKGEWLIRHLPKKDAKEYFLRYANLL
jgi:hypothetical protein